MTDDYQWLEDAADSEVRRWIAEQNGLTSAYLAEIPQRAAIRARVSVLVRSSSSSLFRLAQAGGVLFALRFDPHKQQPTLVVLRADDLDGERTLLDPVASDASAHTTIDWYVPSADGTKVAVSLSHAGTENGTVHVYDVHSGTPTGDVVTHASNATAGGSLAWAPDGAGFYFTRYPHPGERPALDLGFFQQIYFHELGTPESHDRYVLGISPHWRGPVAPMRERALPPGQCGEQGRR